MNEGIDGAAVYNDAFFDRYKRGKPPGERGEDGPAALDENAAPNGQGEPAPVEASGEDSVTTARLSQIMTALERRSEANGLLFAEAVGPVNGATTQEGRMGVVLRSDPSFALGTTPQDFLRHVIEGSNTAPAFANVREVTIDLHNFLRKLEALSDEGAQSLSEQNANYAEALSRGLPAYIRMIDRCRDGIEHISEFTHEGLGQMVQYIKANLACMERLTASHSDIFPTLPLWIYRYRQYEVYFRELMVEYDSFIERKVLTGGMKERVQATLDLLPEDETSKLVAKAHRLLREALSAGHLPEGYQLSGDSLVAQLEDVFAHAIRVEHEIKGGPKKKIVKARPAIVHYLKLLADKIKASGEQCPPITL